MGNDLPKILKAIEEAGYVIRMTSKGHIGIYTADGEWVTTLAGTASDWRSHLNGLAPLRRRGFRWPPTR